MARARRPKLGAWFVIVLLAGGLVAYGVLHPATPTVPASQDPADWHGKTGQHLAVAATINGKWLDGVGVQLKLRCTGGAQAESFLWTPSPELFVQSGEKLSADQAPRRLAATGGWRRSYQGQLRMVVDDRPHGTASVQVTWARGDSRVVCQSGPVPFSLTRRTAKAT